VAFLAGEGVRAVLSLEAPSANEWLVAAEMEGHYIAVPEYGDSPFTGSQLVEAVKLIERHLLAGRPVAVHCHGGTGRANAVVAAYLAHRGATPEAAAQLIIERRPRSVPPANLIAVARRYLAARGGSGIERA
jgi:protein-tyrosine phosphatase